MFKNNKKGFSLIEMMIVIAVVAVLVSIIIPVVGSSTVKANAATNAANLRSVSGAVTSGKLLGDFTINDATYTYYPENEVLTVMGGIEAPNAEECCDVAADTIMWVQIQPDGTALCTYQGYGVDYFAYIAENGVAPDGYTMTPTNQLLNNVMTRFDNYQKFYDKSDSRLLKGAADGAAKLAGYDSYTEMLNAMEKAALENNGQIPDKYAEALNTLDKIFGVTDGTGSVIPSTPSTPETPESSTPESTPSEPASACSNCDSCSGWEDGGRTGLWYDGKCDNCGCRSSYH